MIKRVVTWFLGLVFIVLGQLLTSTITHAAWPSDPTVNVPISTAVNHQTGPNLVSDGAGGAIIAWTDARSDAGDIYAQRVDSSGTAFWATNGVPISTAAGFQLIPRLIADGVGGAIITWSDQRNGFSNEDIYAQRVDAKGNRMWFLNPGDLNGVPVSTEGSRQNGAHLVSDGASGAIIAWVNRRNGNNTDVYAQRVDANGNPLWATNGVPIVTAAGDQFVFPLISDGAGGAIIVSGRCEF